MSLLLLRIIKTIPCLKLYGNNRRENNIHLEYNLSFVTGTGYIARTPFKSTQKSISSHRQYWEDEGTERTLPVWHGCRPYYHTFYIITARSKPQSKTVLLPLSILFFFCFPVSQWWMQFPFLLLVCKFTCSQNSSPERLLLCLKCKVCTPTCQLHKLAEAIINSSEGQQTLAINGAWINSGICKIQTWLAYQKNSFIWYIPEDCLFFQRCFNTLQIWILLANIIFRLSCSLMRIPYVFLYFFLCPPSLLFHPSHDQNEG